jgi:hypothetical protein
VIRPSSPSRPMRCDSPCTTGITRTCPV